MDLILAKLKELKRYLNQINHLGEKVNSPYIAKVIQKLQHIVDNESEYLYVLMQHSYSEEEYGMITRQTNNILGSFLTYKEAFEQGSKIEIKEYHAQFGSEWEYVVIVPIAIGKIYPLNAEFIIGIKKEDKC